MLGYYFIGYNIFKFVWYYFFERGFSEEKILVSVLVDVFWICKIDVVSGFLKEKKKKKIWIFMIYISIFFCLRVVNVLFFNYNFININI